MPQIILYFTVIIISVDDYSSKERRKPVLCWTAAHIEKVKLSLSRDNYSCFLLKCECWKLIGKSYCVLPDTTKPSSISSIPPMIVYAWHVGEINSTWWVKAMQTCSPQSYSSFFFSRNHHTKHKKTPSSVA